MTHRILLLPCLMAMLCSCAVLPPEIPSDIASNPLALPRVESMRDSLVAVVNGWGNRGRFNAVMKRAGELGLAKFTRTEWIDWFSIQENIIIDLPGRSPETIYIVAHYDKTDLNPMRFVSIPLNGALDDLLPLPSLSDGALDNGTGVSVVLELASIIAPMDHFLSYRFLFSGAEESGMRGTRAHLSGLSADEKKRIRIAVNIDTVGTDFAENCLLLPDGEKGIKSRVMAAAHRNHVDMKSATRSGASMSDAETFQENGFVDDLITGFKTNLLGGLLPQRSWFSGKAMIPYVEFSACGMTGTKQPWGIPASWDIHTPGDSIDKVNFSRLYEQYLISAEFLAAEDRTQAGKTSWDCRPQEPRHVEDNH